jgi:hypothetical protein
MVTDDYPVVRASTTCPCCGHPKDVGTLFCWPCYRGGKSIPNFGLVALERFEHHPGRIADLMNQRSYK